MVERAPPIIIPPLQQPKDASQRAAVIFIHGMGDDAAGVEDVGRQIQGAGKLLHVHWIFPNAMDNRDLMSTAWYNITGLKPVPPDRPELKEDEDKDGLLLSMKYIVSLIDDLVEKQGIPAQRIVVGGFSQGCALSLLTGLVSKYAGQLAGIAGLCGYLPVADKIEALREELNTPRSTRMPVFFMRGGNDRMPMSFFTKAQNRLKELGFGEDQVESRVYDGIGHTISGPVIRDLSIWLEGVLPVESTQKA